MAKVQRKVVRKGNRSGRQSLSTGMILLILGGVVIVVVAGVALASGLGQPKPQAANDPTGLAMCGGVPCPSKGDPNAPVTIINVSDYGCSHCRVFDRDTLPKIEEQYVKTGKVHFIAHVFGFQAQTQGVAAAALCAGDQGKFWEYSSILFKNQGSFDAGSISSYAQQVGLNTQAFASCVNSGKYTNTVAASSNSAMAAGVDATPSFFVNGKLIQGALPFQCKPGTPECQFGDFQTLIDAALKGK